MRALDLFCGAGGAGMGLHRAGFDVVGVDLVKQPRYPFAFVQADALNPPFRFADFDFIWASPPCQAHSTVAKQRRSMTPGVYSHPDLVPDTRALLRSSGLPYCIENVMGAPLENPAMLCGSSFGLDVRRHRLFEARGFAMLWPECAHYRHTPRFRSLDQRRNGKLSGCVGVHGHLNYSGESELRKAAMDIDWMNDRELAQAIPPAYSQHIGEYALLALSGSNLAAREHATPTRPLSPHDGGGGSDAE